MIVEPSAMPVDPIETGMTIGDLYNLDTETPVSVSILLVVRRVDFTNYLESSTSSLDPLMTVADALDTYGYPPPGSDSFWHIPTRYLKVATEGEPVNIYSYGEKPNEITPFNKTSRFSANDIIVESASGDTTVTANVLYSLNGLLHQPERFTDYHTVLRDAYSPNVESDFNENSIQVIKRSPAGQAPAIRGTAPILPSPGTPNFIETKLSLLPSVNYNTPLVRAFDTNVFLSNFRLGVVIAGLFFPSSNYVTYDQVNSNVLLLDFSPPSNMLGLILTGLYGRVELPISPKKVDKDKKEVQFLFNDVVSETFIDWLISRPNTFIMATNNFTGYNNVPWYPVSKASERSARPFRLTVMDEVGLVMSDALEGIIEAGGKPFYSVSIVHADTPDVSPVTTPTDYYSVVTI